MTLGVGLWFWSGVVAPGYWSTIVLGVLWFVACSVIFGRIGKARPELRPWVRGTFLACSVAAVFAFYWTSMRDTVVDEDDRDRRAREPGAAARSAAAIRSRRSPSPQAPGRQDRPRPERRRAQRAR